MFYFGTFRNTKQIFKFKILKKTSNPITISYFNKALILPLFSILSLFRMLLILFDYFEPLCQDRILCFCCIPNTFDYIYYYIFLNILLIISVSI